MKHDCQDLHASNCVSNANDLTNDSKDLSVYFPDETRILQKTHTRSYDTVHV